MKRFIVSFAAAAAPVWGQCAMCFRNASAQSAAQAQAFNSAILVLGIPPLVLLGGFAWLAWKRRNE